MPRAIWTGTLQFVLISFPVKLYKAVDDKGVSFKTIHAVCGNSINLKKWCNVCGREALADELHKGYEIVKGQYVLFSEEEIENALPENAKTIKIEKAVPAEQIPTIVYENSYFISPDKGGEHVYNLLLSALTIRPKVLIGRVVMRNKEHLVAIRPYQDGLLLSLLHFADEIRDIHEVVYVKEKKVDEKELNLAASLLDYLTGSFDQIDQRDIFRQYIETMAETKASGQVITIEPIKKVKVQANIIEGLQKSIEILTTGKVKEVEVPVPTITIKEKKVEEKVEEEPPVLEIPGIKTKEKVEKSEPIKQQLDKLFGVTEEEINKLILEQRIEEEQDRINILKELAGYKSFEEYVKGHQKEFEGIHVGDDFKSITIDNDVYPRINLPILKRIGIVIAHFRILAYMKPSKDEKKEIARRDKGLKI